MDESSLLDLLECSVCLERLDTSAKVLPCQHTFCRRCLQSIVSSRSELRCPECRILVDCSVDELPANILLVRLLDGIKQRPHNSSASPPGTVIRDAPAANRSSPVKGTHRSMCVEHHITNIPQLPCGKALYNYEGKEPGDLRFNKGDIIILRRKVDENWYHGELNGSHGFLPASYIQCIKPLAQPPPQGKALYDFEVKDKDQDKDCLTFTKDEILTVIRRVDDNWAEGMLGDKIGIFPLLYVELNETAKQLMELDKPCPPCGPDSSAPAGSCSTSSATLNGTGVVSAIHRHIDCKKNTKKRHSFTALSMTHRTAQAMNNRHSMEISAPVLISSSDPRAAARIGDTPHLSSSAPSQDSSPSLVGTSVVTAAPPRITSTAADQAGATLTKVQLPLNMAPFAMGSSRSTLPGSAQTMKGVTNSPQPTGSSSPILMNAVTRPVGPMAAPPTSPQMQQASAQPKTCPRMSGQQTVNQARMVTQTVPVHPQAQTPERPTATVPPLRTQSSPSRSPVTVVRPHAMLSPQHVHQPPIPSTSGTLCARPIIPLTSAAAAITPPNVSAANLNGETINGPLHQCLLSLAPANNSPTLPKGEEKKTEKKEKKGVLLKLLSGASAKKKSRSPPSVSPTHEPSPQASSESPIQGAMAPELPSVSNHGRAGSCPIESEMQGAMGMEPLHRKSGSLDLNFSVSPPARQPCSSLIAIRPEPKPLSRERYRVVVPYPPQSEAEIELKEGDIVFVHKKREDGWFKGTLQRTGRTGLFPGSFVESF
ncbi:E3 ubiquitin-protein ligase SH3RF3-like isoform X2 [Polypterus senegalus]|uniref:E3 ubiquitin-protein ligase SH3RF3-like isoform X2 n=1 Tax=Polypterus senegalus TaxID=55291 RepID=UPI00196528C2|nr:E3 ubiquitin-protein ligase SH3RF3-like isoform X2 [Polypterus senegalus]